MPCTKVSVVVIALTISAPALAQQSMSSIMNGLAQKWSETHGQPLSDRLRGVVEQGRLSYGDIQQQAMVKLARAIPSGSCADRTQRFVALVPEAERLADMARSVYRGQGDVMAARSLNAMDLGPGRRAYQANNGDFYAETASYPSAREAVIVFRGTRSSSRSDVFTDVSNFSGVDIPCHQWARGLAARVAQAHPEWRIVATGHSLGGGLALAAALAVPKVEAVAFDPAGLSNRAWQAASREDQERTLAASTAFIAVTNQAMDPVSAGSVTGMSVIPARIYAIPVEDGGSPRGRHAIAALESGIRGASASPQIDCGYDVGNIGVSDR